MKVGQPHKRKYWKKSERLTNCKVCGTELAPHKIYYCTSACGDKHYKDSKVKVI